MKLTLLKEDNVLLEYNEHEKDAKYWTSYFQDTTPPDIPSWLDNDFARKKFIWSRITEKPTIDLQVFVGAVDKNKREHLQVQSNEQDESKNILKRLRNVFGEKVTISVRMEASEGTDKEGEESTSVFQDGLNIHEIGAAYGGYVNLSCFREMRFDITVMADISDDHEIIRQSEEEMPFSQMMNRRMLNDGLASDAVITSKDGKEVKCHKSFLIAASPVLQRMLEESQTSRIDMSDLSEEGVSAFLRYIYCGDAIEPEADFNLAFELLRASHKYQIFLLEEFMMSYWIGMKYLKIDVRSAFKIYMFVKDIATASQLKEKMVRVLHRKYAELKQLPEYDELYKTPSDAKELCEDLVNVSKSDLE